MGFEVELQRKDQDPLMRRILVVDDQADVRAMIAIVLRVNHFEVVEAGSDAAALKEFENSKFDLAIVDIFLAEANGFDVIGTMRERIPDLPVVAVSGMAMLDFVAASPESSSMISLQKPFRPGQLLRAVEMALGSSSTSVADKTKIAGAVHP
jgi:DNA-binding NtrC family response regulator